MAQDSSSINATATPAAGDQVTVNFDPASAMGATSIQVPAEDAQQWVGQSGVTSITNQSGNVLWQPGGSGAFDQTAQPAGTGTPLLMVPGGVPAGMGTDFSPGTDSTIYPRNPLHGFVSGESPGTTDDYPGSDGGYGGYGSGGYGGSSGGYGGRFGYGDIMRSAGLDAGRMGAALRGAMGAPQPKMPGGEGGGGGYRRPAYVPGGASVDSYGNPKPAPAPYHATTPPWPGAYQSWGGGASGGGTPPQAPTLASAQGRIQAAMGEARGRIQGATGGGYAPSGGGGSLPPGSTPPPAPGSSGGGSGQPPTERMHGWARRQGYSAPMVTDILGYHPEAALPDAVPGLKPGDPMFAALANMPIDPNAMMMLGKGATKKGWTPDASDTANNINRVYDDFMAGRQADPGAMMDNMLDPRKGSALDMQLEGATPEQAAYTLGNYFATITGAMPPAVAAANQAAFQNATTGYLNKALGANPRHVPDITKYLSRKGGF